MRFSIISLLLLAGLNLISARSFWNPNLDYNDYDLFRFPSNKILDDSDEISSPQSDNWFNFDHINKKIEEKIKDDNKQKEEEDEDVNSILIWIFVNDDDESNKVKSNIDAEKELIDLTKSSEEKANDDQDQDLVITENDIKELNDVLVALNALDELLKLSDDNIKKIHSSSEEQEQFKDFDDFLKSMFEMIEEDEQNTNDSKEDNNDDDNVTTTTTPKSDSSEENDNTTTPKTDSSEEDDVTTPKSNSEEDKDNDNDSEDNDDNNNTNDSNEFETISLVLHGIDDTEKMENIDNHIYETIDAFKPTSSPYIPEAIPSTSYNTDDENIIQHYVEIREDLDTEQNKFKINKLNLDKDFYNIISSNYNDEGIKKFENDVNVLHENFDRIKRQINGMENLNTKLYFQNLITTAVKKIQNKSKYFMESK